MGSRRIAWLMVVFLLAFPAVGSGGTKAVESFCPVVARGEPPMEGPGSGKFTGYLLGAWSGKGWLESEAASALLRGGERFRFYNLAGEAGAAVGGPASPYGDQDDPCHEIQSVSFVDPPGVRGDLVAVGGSFNVLPRNPKMQSTEQQVYKDAAAAILREKGIANPRIRLTAVIRVDLDGDGSEEVLVSATHYAGGVSPKASPGDYSLVFLRKVVKGKVVQQIIAGDFFPAGVDFGAPGEYRIGAVLDLNGDGVMEIVLFGRYYEGDWVEAHRLDGERVVKIFSTGCGA